MCFMEAADVRSGAAESVNPSPAVTPHFPLHSKYMGRWLTRSAKLAMSRVHMHAWAEEIMIFAQVFGTYSLPPDRVTNFSFAPAV